MISHFSEQSSSCGIDRWDIRGNWPMRSISRSIWAPACPESQINLQRSALDFRRSDLDSWKTFRPVWSALTEASKHRALQRSSTSLFWPGSCSSSFTQRVPVRVAIRFNRALQITCTFQWQLTTDKSLMISQLMTILVLILDWSSYVFNFWKRKIFQLRKFVLDQFWDQKIHYDIITDGQYI